MCYEMTRLHKRARAYHSAGHGPVLRNRRAEPGRTVDYCNLQWPRGSGLDAHVLTRAFLQKRSEPNPKLTKRTKVNQSQNWQLSLPRFGGELTVWLKGA